MRQTQIRPLRQAMSAIALLVPLAAAAAGPPEAMRVITGAAALPAAQVAQQDVLALNAMMFELYGQSGQIIGRNILAQHPVILALFSTGGGRLQLYRPGLPVQEAPPVPVGYQLLKSIGHSTMAIAVAVGPALDKPADLAWLGSLQAYRARMRSAADSLGASGMPAEWIANNRDILARNLAFMDGAIAARSVSYAAFQDFTGHIGPLLKQNVAWAAQLQVAHWMGVVADWKALLGADWDKTYAASNTIYVTRQNNVLFSVLAQFFGAEAINDRLILIETMSFTTSPGEMIEALTRIIADRAVGSAFFGNDRLMDYELMGGDARVAIIAETAKRAMKSVLPPAVPFGSHQWPSLVTAGPGPASLADLP